MFHARHGSIGQQVVVQERAVGFQHIVEATDHGSVRAQAEGGFDLLDELGQPLLGLLHPALAGPLAQDPGAVDSPELRRVRQGIEALVDLAVGNHLGQVAEGTLVAVGCTQRIVGGLHQRRVLGAGRHLRDSAQLLEPFGLDRLLHTLRHHALGVVQDLMHDRLVVGAALDQGDDALERVVAAGLALHIAGLLERQADVGHQVGVLVDQPVRQADSFRWQLARAFGACQALTHPQFATHAIACPGLKLGFVALLELALQRLELGDHALGVPALGLAALDDAVDLHGRAHLRHLVGRRAGHLVQVRVGRHAACGQLILQTLPLWAHVVLDHADDFRAGLDGHRVFDEVALGDGLADIDRTALGQVGQRLVDGSDVRLASGRVGRDAGRCLDLDVGCVGQRQHSIKVGHLRSRDLVLVGLLPLLVAMDAQAEDRADRKVADHLRHAEGFVLLRHVGVAIGLE